jgi:hypothetical protein
MRLCSILTVSIMSLSLANAVAQGSDTFEITVRAFTPADAPLGEQTGTCSPVQPCRFSWSLGEGGQHKSISVLVKELRPGVLQVLADNGPFRVGATRLANESGAVGELSAVTQSAGRRNVLMKFQVTRR